MTGWDLEAAGKFLTALSKAELVKRLLRAEARLDAIEARLAPATPSTPAVPAGKA